MPLPGATDSVTVMVVNYVGIICEKERLMAIQEWSDDIIVADLADDPQFTDEISALMDKLGLQGPYG